MAGIGVSRGGGGAVQHRLQHRLQHAGGRASAWLTGLLVVLAVGGCALALPWPVRVVDGDTVDRGLWRYRIVGYDTPEIRRAKCAAERERALAAKARLAELLAGAQRVDLVRVRSGADPWGRVLARLEIDGRDAATIAAAEGWGVPYSGRGARRDWCAIKAEAALPPQ